MVKGSVAYDKQYQKSDLFGKSYAGLIDFFEAFEPKGSVLDLGCGQGRDAVPLAQMGYQVTGVDVSSVGVNQMLQKAKALDLKINGIVGDIYWFEIDDRYDMVLLDSMFHFENRDKEKETMFLKRVMGQLKSGGVLCIFVWKSERIEGSLMDVFETSGIKWEMLEDTYTDYPEMNMQYRMVVARKVG